LHDHQGALEDLDRAHELDPCDVWILESQGNVKIALHDHQGALEDFNRAHEPYPCDVGILESRANVKVALHDHQGALEDLDRAHELDPCDVGILESQANVKVALHDHQGALEDFDRAHELDARDVGILRSRGNVKVTLHDHQGALEDLDRAHELDLGDIGILASRSNVEVTLLEDLIPDFIPDAAVDFVFAYFMGTYSNGTWEFRPTYVCIELRLGSYPFQKFREKPPSHRYIGIRIKERIGRNGKYTRYEPHLKLNNDAFYFCECKTCVKAAFIYDIAKLCPGVKDGNFNMLCPQRYDHLQKISVEGHTKKEILKIVFECAESTFQSIKDHPTNGDNRKILKLFEDGGEGYAMNVHQMTLNENLASLGSNGGDDHATRCSIDFNAIEALLNSPNDGDVPAIDIDEHAQVLGESTGKHNMTFKPSFECDDVDLLDCNNV